MILEMEKIITDFEEAKSYVYSMDQFHDYRVGSFDIKGSNLRIIVEEDMKNINNDGAKRWWFSFEGISNLEIDMDLFCPSYINEIEIEGNTITFSFIQGYISFSALSISLEIPKIRSDEN